MSKLQRMFGCMQSKQMVESKKEMRTQCCSYTVGRRDARCSCAFLFDRRRTNDSARAKHRKPAMKCSDVLQSYSPDGRSIHYEQK